MLRPRASAPNLSAFDYIIVGAGSAGCVIARRLIEQTDATILLIEAGRSDKGRESVSVPHRWLENIGADHDWKYSYAPAPATDNRRIPLSRGKLIGGCGSTNALVWARGNRADYDGWARAGNIGWDFDSVLPLFRKSEDWEDGACANRGSGGPMRIERAKDLHPVAEALIESGTALGLPYLDDINIPAPEGAGPINMNVADGERCSTARAFLHPVTADPRLTVMPEAQAVRLRFTGSRCSGVEYLRRGSPGVVHADTEVILCAGSIDTPRLLMLSGIGPAADMHAVGIETRVDSPNVGKNLQDHPLVAGLCFAARAGLPSPNNNLEGSVLFAKSRSGLQAADLMFVSVQVPFFTPEIGARHAVPQSASAFSIIPGLMNVESRGHLRMLSDRFDGPLEIQPNFLAEPSDVEAMLAAIELGQELASHPSFYQISRGWMAPPGRLLRRKEALSFLRQSCSTYFHPVGTCAMGPDAEAVVDTELKVRGVTGLRIADASIMPRITSANTHAPTVMIAEFASQLIARDQIPGP